MHFKLVVGVRDDLKSVVAHGRVLEFAHDSLRVLDGRDISVSNVVVFCNSKFMLCLSQHELVHAAARFGRVAAVGEAQGELLEDVEGFLGGIGVALGKVLRGELREPAVVFIEGRKRLQVHDVVAVGVVRIGLQEAVRTLNGLGGVAVLPVRVDQLDLGLLCIGSKRIASLELGVIVFCIGPVALFKSGSGLGIQFVGRPVRRRILVEGFEPGAGGGRQRDGRHGHQPRGEALIRKLEITVEGFWGERLDKVLATLMPDVSRARLQKLIEEGSVEVNGEVVQKVRQKVTEGDEISLLEEPHLDEALAFTPEEDVEFDVVYEDDAIVVVNKPAGLVVHPGAGNPCGTLLNGLLWRYPELREVPRAGIVHRLDRDTTGLMVVARTLAAQTNLVRQLQERTVKREYWAFTLGSAAPDFVVETPIGRDPRSRTRFKCFPGSTGVRAKPARTRARCVGWSSIEGLPVSWVACRLDTGRTHQIRVHLTSEDLPLIGDQVYRGRAPGLTVKVENELDFHRQALHASRLGLDHPVTGEYMEWFVPPEDDMIDLMDELGFGPWNVPVRVFENERL